MKRSEQHGSWITFAVSERLKWCFSRILANGQTIRWETQKPILAEIIHRLPDVELAIDVGCGGGTYAIELLAPKAKRVVALDYRWQHAWMTRERALRRGLSHLDVIVASAEALPFMSQTADLMLCAEVLEHLSDDRRAMAEFARVSRDHCRLVCSVPYPPAPIENPDHVREGYTRSELEGILSSAGFLIREVRFCMFTLSRLVMRWCSNLRLPLPALFLCQIEHFLSRRGVAFSNPHDMIVLAELSRNGST